MIDEAQLLSELPLALKNYLDDAGYELQVLLTGSAQIGRTGFGEGSSASAMLRLLHSAKSYGRSPPMLSAPGPSGHKPDPGRRHLSESPGFGYSMFVSEEEP